jgi:hypothetical protein
MPVKIRKTTQNKLFEAASKKILEIAVVDGAMVKAVMVSIGCWSSHHS